MNKLKQWYYTGGKDIIIIELKSAWQTFIAIFLGSIAVSPVINNFFNLDLPTIQGVKDVLPVILDTAYRAAWITLLTQTGLSKYRK